MFPALVARPVPNNEMVTPHGAMVAVKKEWTRLWVMKVCAVDSKTKHTFRTFSFKQQRMRKMTMTITMAAAVEKHSTTEEVLRLVEIYVCT